MRRILAAVVLGASMIFTTAAAFADVAEHESSRQLIEQPVAVTPDDIVVPGDPGQYNVPFKRLGENEHGRE